MAENKVLKGINFPGLEGTYYVPEAIAVEDENGYVEIKSYISDTVEVDYQKLGYSTPEMHGAIGDGVNDDAGAFANAINNSDYVFLTSDLYLFTPVAITGKPRLVVDGNGYTINFKNIERALQITDSTNIVFRNIIFDGNSCTTQGVLFIGCENIQVENCAFKNMTTSSAADGDTWGLNFRDSKDMCVDFCSFINIDGSDNSSKVANGIVVHGHTKGCENITISNCYFDTILPVNDACGISLIQSSFYDTPLYGVVENCLFVDCAKRAVKIIAQYVTVNNCNIVDVSSNDQHSSLIDIMASHCRVTNNTINVNRATNGISCQYVAETSTITDFDDIVIENNYIDVANEDSTTARDGLTVGITDDTKKYTEVIVKNNIVKGRFRYAFKAMYISDSVIDGNTFEGEVRLGNRSLNDRPCNNIRIVNNTMKGSFEASVTHSLLAHNEFLGSGGIGIYFPTYTNGSPSNLRIVGNKFDNLSYGIDGRRQAMDNVIITENIFTNITAYDMYLLGTNYVLADNVPCKGVAGTFETVPEPGIAIADVDGLQDALGQYLPLSGGAMTGVIDASGTGNVIDFGPTGYFRGATSSGNKFDFFGLRNSTSLVVGGSYPALELKGKNERPTYNGSNIALQSDIPTLTTETWTFTLEDGSTVTKAVYLK